MDDLDKLLLYYAPARPGSKAEALSTPEGRHQVYGTLDPLQWESGNVKDQLLVLAHNLWARRWIRGKVVRIYYTLKKEWKAVVAKNLLAETGKKPSVALAEALSYEAEYKMNLAKALVDQIDVDIEGDNNLVNDIKKLIWGVEN